MNFTTMAFGPLPETAPGLRCLFPSLISILRWVPQLLQLRTLTCSFKGYLTASLKPFILRQLFSACNSSLASQWPTKMYEVHVCAHLCVDYRATGNISFSFIYIASPMSSWHSSPRSSNLLSPFSLNFLVPSSFWASSHFHPLHLTKTTLTGVSNMFMKISAAASFVSAVLFSLTVLDSIHHLFLPMSSSLWSLTALLTLTCLHSSVSASPLLVSLTILSSSSHLSRELHFTRNLILFLLNWAGDSNLTQS